MGTPRSFLRLACALALLALTLATPAMSASRMWIGFQDDPNLRWNDHRPSAREQTVAEHATMLRTWAYWPYIAPQQPTDPTDSDDPAYRFQDLDEFVRQAQIHGQEVLITLWGTPSWANGGKGPNRLPTNIGAFQQFAYAVAHRYNGRTPGFPYVRFYSIWNEPNLAQFLSPQFSGKKDVGPANYAKLYRAGYAGVKAGSPQAFVAVGETSPRGHDKHVNGIQDSNSPGHFAQLARAAEAGDQVRRVGAPPVRPARRRAARAGQVSERDALQPGPLRGEPAHVLQAQGRADLDHGVRARDEAGRAEGRDVRAAGELREDRAAGGREAPGRADVRLVRAPRRPDLDVAERVHPRERRAEAGLLHVLEDRRRPRRAQRRVQRRAREARRDSCASASASWRST